MPVQRMALIHLAGAPLALMLFLSCSQPGETEIARGNVLVSTGKKSEAEAAYRAASLAAPKRSRPLELLGHVLADQNKKTEARAAYEKALALSPDALEAHIGLARLDADEGQMDQALDRLGKLLEHQKDNLYARLSRANLALKRGGPQDAELAIQDTAFAMRIDDKNPSVLYTRGSAFLAAGKLPEAAEAFGLLVTRHPGSPLGYYGTARVQATRGDKPGALAQLKEARGRSLNSATWNAAEVLKDPAFTALLADPEFAAHVQVL